MLCRSRPGAWRNQATRSILCYAVGAMGRRKKPRFKIPKEARRRARLSIGLPPPERVIVEKRYKPPKHKKTAAELLEEI